MIKERYTEFARFPTNRQNPKFNRYSLVAMVAALQEIKDSDFRMAFAADATTLWEHVDLAESFLVCCMYEEALSKSKSVIVDAKSLPDVEQTELLQIEEAAGMVLVQSLKELGRSCDIMKELVLLFGQTTSIPVELLLAGVCIQVSVAPSGVQSFLEEFLNKWRCVDENHYVLKVEATSPSYVINSGGTLTLDKYMELVELYAVVILGKLLNTVDDSLAWVKKAEIPEANREDLLRKLHAMHSHKTANIAPLSRSNKNEVHISSQNGLQVSDASSEASKVEDASKQSILKLSSGVQPCFWFFRSVTLKFGKVRLVITTTKILLACLVFLIVYLVKRKRQTLLRVAKEKVISAKKALVDLWQLAFSYQVNPLAAVQPLPVATQGMR